MSHVPSDRFPAQLFGREDMPVRPGRLPGSSLMDWVRWLFQHELAPALLGLLFWFTWTN